MALAPKHFRQFLTVVEQQKGQHLAAKQVLEDRNNILERDNDLYLRQISDLQQENNFHGP